MRWLLLSLALMVGTAQSQEPTPSPTKRAEGSKPHAAKGTQKAKQDQRGTASSPLVVDVRPVRKTEAEVAQDTKDRDDREKDARRSFLFNLLLVLFNGALAVGTILLWIVTGRAARAAEASAKASMTALTDLERPWVFIKGAHIKRRENQGEPRIPNYYWISFVARNVGRTPAIVEECIVKVHDSKAAPDIPDYGEPTIHLRCPATVEVGAEFETSAFGPPSQPGVNLEDATEYVIYGRITYRELNGKEHRSGFSFQVSSIMPASTNFPKQAYDYYN